MPRLYAVLSLFVLACTERPSSFRCEVSEACVLGGVQGTCEATGACSFPDGACAETGRRYGRFAPADLAERCVPPVCGGPGEPCCASGAACEAGLSCDAGVCRGCVVQVAAGRAHSCALKRDGAVYCWGSNESGQLGTGGTAASVLPAPVVDGRGQPIGGVVAIAAGGDHACARRADGTLFCWGADAAPRAELVALTDVAAVAVGERHRCAALTTGLAYCWGANDEGQLGTPPPGSSAMPIAVVARGTHLGEVASLAAGKAHGCAVKRDGALWCWGGNGAGELGFGQMGGAQEPGPVSALGTQVAEAAAGSRFTCARRKDDTAVCWGAADGGFGALAPTRVGALNLVAQVAAGDGFACARRAGGRVYCWGRNDRGQLGHDGTDVAAVRALDDAGAIAAGGAHACAATARGAVCWGAGAAGQLGGGGTSDASEPVAAAIACD